MKAIGLPKRTALSDEAAIAPNGTAYGLRITGIYQDLVTRDWALQSCRRATQLAGDERVEHAWYNANSLSDAGTLQDAIRATLVADVIVVSVYAADELPRNLYVWFEAWLPRRLSRVGALAALMGVAEPQDSQSLRTLKYLKAMARKAKLDFIPQQRKRPVASPASSIQQITKPAGASMQALQDFHGQRYDVYHHWGLNE